MRWGSNAKLLKYGICETMSAVNRYRPVIQNLYLVEVLHEIWVLVGNVLLHKRCRLEQLLTSLAAEFALILLLDVGFTGP